MNSMTTYPDALNHILANVQVMKVEEKPLLKCLGQITAENVYSDFNLPQMDSSGPDGYAVRAEDIEGASPNNPVTLNIIETVRAGFLPQNTVKPYSAIRIMTGSVLPAGADCVVRFEETDEPQNKNGPNNANPTQVKIYITLKPGTNVIPAGRNLKKGSLVVPAGTAIGPAQLSALISLGKTRLKVFRRPVISIITTGDELVRLGCRLPPGKSFNSNIAVIPALIAHYGGIAKVIGTAGDSEDAIIEKIQQGLSADAVITSGGVSKGDYDLTRLVMGKMGEVIFARIKMGPGASFAFGKINNPDINSSVPMFGLAGPPAGCMINLETLVRPAILKMLGFPVVAHPAVEATALDSVPDKKPMSFVKWTSLDKVDGEYQVKLNVMDNMGALASMAAANSLTIVPEGSTISPGDKIKVLPLDWTTN